MQVELSGPTIYDGKYIDVQDGTHTIRIPHCGLARGLDHLLHPQRRTDVYLIEHKPDGSHIARLQHQP